MAFDNKTCLKNFAAGAGIAAGIGALAGLFDAVLRIDGSGFFLWVASLSSIIGAVVGAVSFMAGAVTYALLHASPWKVVPRIGAVLIAGLLASALVFCILASIKHLHVVSTTVGVGIVALVAAAVLVRPFERAFGVDAQ